MTPEAPARIRPAKFEDAQAINQVDRQNGMGDSDLNAWRARWEAYPFAEEFRDVPIGWVLETEAGEVVGSLGNVHMLYDLGGRRLKAGIATAWSVSMPYRKQALKLMTTFYRQKGVDLYLNGSANTITSQILEGFKIPRIPLPDYSRPCFWAVRPHGFAHAALARRSTPGAAILAYPAGLALNMRDLFVRSGRGSLSAPVRTLTGFDDRFDSLWKEIRSGPPRLRAIRTRAVLEWRFGAAVRSGRGVILASEKGYVVLLRREGSELGMEMYDVADLQAAGDDPRVITDLLLGSIEFARKKGVDAVKFVTGTPAKRRAADALRPYTYVMPLWQLYCRTSSEELSKALSTADAWDFSVFETY